MTFSKKPILVFTPLILNSRNALSNRKAAPLRVLPLAEIFTNRESKKGEILAPV